MKYLCFNLVVHISCQSQKGNEEREGGAGAIFKKAQTDFDYDDKVKSSGADDDDEGGVNILKDQDGVVMIGHNEENKQINR